MHEAPASTAKDTIADRRITVGQLSLNIRESGEGQLVVFMHGITANAAVWDPVLSDLADTFRVVSMDQRGHGRSDKPDHGYGAQDYARDSIALVESLDAGPALMVGHSLGARNALVAATLSPSLVSGVVAIDFTPFIEAEVFDALSSRVESGDQVFASEQAIAEYLRQRYRRLPDDSISRRVTYGYRSAADGGYRPLADPRAMAATANGLREDLVKPVADVRCPVLLMRGEESTMVSREAYARTLALRPDFSSMVVDDVDHYLPEEAPDVVTQAIRKFAAEISQSGGDTGTHA